MALSSTNGSHTAASSETSTNAVVACETSVHVASGREASAHADASREAGTQAVTSRASSEAVDARREAGAQAVTSLDLSVSADADASRETGGQAVAATEDRIRVVDRALRTIARRRAGLDADEARWLREAEALTIWRSFGMVSAFDYMERVLGYAPRTARERLRVALALGELPKLTAALAGGVLAYSAVRELSRVATGVTEEEWCARAMGKTLREIEELVADHRLGDRPDDPKDPAARTHVVRLELSAETFALLRQAHQVLDDEHGARLSEDQLVAQLCSAVLDGTAPGENTGRAKFQVAVTVCEQCQQGWQHGAGAKIAIGPAAVERALCDAQHIGSIDGDAPARAYQDVSPSVARFVWHRDGGRCRIPGCRSSRGLEIHHLIHRADGGGHEPANLILACSSCHLAHHAGTLTIIGTADRVEVTRAARRDDAALECADTVVESGTLSADPGAHVGRRDARATRRPDDAHGNAAEVTAPLARVATSTTAAAKLDLAERCAEAKVALKLLGWPPAIAQDAVRDAVAALGADATLELVLGEAVRRCPKPPGTMSTMRNTDAVR